MEPARGTLQPRHRSRLALSCPCRVTFSCSAVTDAALPVFAAMKIVQAAACGEARPGPGVDQDSIEQSVGVEEEPAPADLEEVNEVEDPFDLEEVEDMSCIASADDYTAYLERLLTRPVSRYFRKICPWLNLFTTVEALDAETGNTPVTLRCELNLHGQ